MGIKRIFNKIAALATVCCFVISGMTGTVTAFSETALMPLQKGMCYVTWDRDRFATQYSDNSLTKLSEMGVEYISLCVTEYQEKYNSTRIEETDKTPSSRSVKHVIRKAHDLGMKVMLKPHIDLIDKFDGTYWRADIGFATEKDWEEWFEEYEDFIIKYAKIAQRCKVDIFCVGTELSFTAQKEDKWREIIAKVKKIYDGKLVYAANWDNFKNIGFWDEMDYVGIDAYFPLSYDPDPSMEDLKKGWEKWKKDIAYWQSQINKPIIFTELGYASTAHAPYSPWKGGYSGNADPEIQAKCYKAFFDTVWKEPWFAGVYWWKWDTNTRAGGEHNRQFTPQNKPAQRIIEANYKGMPGDSDYAMIKAEDQR
ncbi:MAG: hypothetical protein GF408_02455 [Candidatus Omnitrophica bacterium]|nr:hypothetical protein [Candidatus Omnitrophota bacterium]